MGRWHSGLMRWCDAQSQHSRFQITLHPVIIYQFTVYPCVKSLWTHCYCPHLRGVIHTPFAKLPLHSIVVRLSTEQHQRGAANGLSMTGMSLFKSMGPAAGGALLTWSQKRMDASFLPGTHLVFFALNIVEGLGILMLFKPFLGEKKRTPTDH